MNSHPFFMHAGSGATPAYIQTARQGTAERRSRDADRIEGATNRKQENVSSEGATNRKRVTAQRPEGAKHRRDKYKGQPNGGADPPKWGERGRTPRAARGSAGSQREPRGATAAQRGHGREQEGRKTNQPRDSGTKTAPKGQTAVPTEERKRARRRSRPTGRGANPTDQESGSGGGSARRQPRRGEQPAPRQRTSLRERARYGQTKPIRSKFQGGQTATSTKDASKKRKQRARRAEARGTRDNARAPRSG